MQKKTLRAVCIILALLTVLPMLFACDNDASTTDDKGSTNQSGNPNNPNQGGNTDDPENPTGWQDVFNVPDTKYDGAEFNVLTAGNVGYVDFGFAETSESVLEQAQYRREATILQEYDVKIVETQKVNKSSFGGGPGFTAFNTAATTNSLEYHLGIIGGYDVAKLAEANALFDINSVNYIETKNSWWDQNANNDLTINGMLFFTNGSLTSAYSESTFVIYMNKGLAEEALPAGTDVYQVVKDMQWTVDKLAEYARTVSEDLNGDDVMDGNDRYGIYIWDDSMLGMMGAAGTKSATVMEDGSIELTLNNENTINMFNKFSEIAYSKEFALQYQRKELKPSEGVLNAFQANKALFWQTSNTNTKNLRGMEVDYGILPYPMLHAEQGRYYSTVAPYNSQFICVPIYLEDQEDFIGHITEALAYYGKQIVWPACYENTMKGSYARDEGTYEMLDIIYGNYGYDIGYYYQVGKFPTVLMTLLRESDTGFASKYEATAPSAMAEIQAINDNYQLVFEWWAQHNAEE